MTKLTDILGEDADRLAQHSISIGDVHLISLDERNGITPKDGDTSRDKFFIVLGFDGNGNVIGGLVINSRINKNLPSVITDYHLPVTVRQCPFLSHNSFINCSLLVRAGINKFSSRTYRGEISDKELMRQIIETVKESPTVSRMSLKEFGII